jgi:SAM-dependent methyltransferase
VCQDPAVTPSDAPYYRPDLARVHHLGFGFHADACAAGILDLLKPTLEGDGLVLELGCGSGLLTRHLVDAGHRVIATVFSQPAPDVFVRDITTFLRNDDGSWRRDDERHRNVLLDTTLIPGLLSRSGVDVTVQSSFGSETLPLGLRVVVGRRP